MVLCFYVTTHPIVGETTQLYCYVEPKHHTPSGELRRRYTKPREIPLVTNRRRDMYLINRPTAACTYITAHKRTWYLI